MTFDEFIKSLEGAYGRQISISSREWLASEMPELKDFKAIYDMILRTSEVMPMPITLKRLASSIKNDGQAGDPTCKYCHGSGIINFQYAQLSEPFFHIQGSLAVRQGLVETMKCSCITRLDVTERAQTQSLPALYLMQEGRLRPLSPNELIRDKTRIFVLVAIWSDADVKNESVRREKERRSFEFVQRLQKKFGFDLPTLPASIDQPNYRRGIANAVETYLTSHGVNR